MVVITVTVKIYMRSLLQLENNHIHSLPDNLILLSRLAILQKCTGGCATFNAPDAQAKQQDIIIILISCPSCGPSVEVTLLYLLVV